MKTERVLRVSLFLYFEYAGMGTMFVDCVRRRSDTVFEANTHRYRRELFIKHFCNTKLVIYDIIIFGKSYVISVF